MAIFAGLGVFLGAAFTLYGGTELMCGPEAGSGDNTGGTLLLLIVGISVLVGSVVLGVWLS